MLRFGADSIAEQLDEQMLIAERLASVPARFAGLTTLLALACWTYGGIWAAGFVSQRIVLTNFSIFVGFQMEMQDPPSEAAADNGDWIPTNSQDMEDIEDPVAEGLRLLDLRRQAKPPAAQPGVAQLRKRQAAFTRDWERLVAVQGVATVTWIVVMILTGAFMLCAGVSSLSGSHRARKWHRQVVYWTFFATACTIGGMLALVRWGGFPPIPDPWILAKIAAIQSSYAVAIIIALIATRRRAVQE